jgi:hypothetical protein
MSVPQLDGGRLVVDLMISNLDEICSFVGNFELETLLGIVPCQVHISKRAET